MSNVLLGQVPQYAVAADYSVSSPITTGSPVYADVAQSPNPSPANTGNVQESASKLRNATQQTASKIKDYAERKVRSLLKERELQSSPMEQQIIAPVSTDTLKRDTINADKIVSDEFATQGGKGTDDELKEGFKISAPVILLGAAAIYFFFFRKK